MSETRNEVEFARAAGAVDVLAIDSPGGIFVWYTDPTTGEVLGKFAHEIHSVEDVRAHLIESRKKIARIDAAKNF